MSINPDSFNRIIRDWLTQFDQERLPNLRKSKLIATGSLRNSYTSKLTPLASGFVSKIQWRFNFYGRLYDRSNVQRPLTGRKLINALKEWIKAIGISKFQYNNASKLSSNPDTALTQQAFAIAKGLKAHKRRSWYTTGRTKSIRTLSTELADQLGEILVTESSLTLRK